MADYNSSYTGPQIDNAVAAGLAVRAVDGIVKSDGNGNFSAAVADEDYVTPMTSSGQGSLVSFSDGVAGLPLKSLVVNINPVQAGSGDPSPTNIRAITGWTGASIKRTGKNLFDEATVLGGQGFTQQQDGSWYCAGSKYSSINQQHIYDNIGYAGQLSVTFRYKNSTSTIGAYPSIAYVGGTNDAIPHPASTTVSTGTLTSNDSKVVDYIRWLYYSSSSSLYCNIQIELGDEATEYEPYAGSTYAVDWQSQAGTVYGGQLDVNTGKLTVTHAAITFTGTENWVLSNSRFQLSVSGVATQDNYGDPKVRCNAFDAISFEDRLTKQGVVVGYTGAAYLYFYVLSLLSISTVDQWKAWLAQNNVTVVYPLATPVVYQLTPVEIIALLGKNNIWANCGDVAVEYMRSCALSEDVQAMIDATVLGAMGGSY